MNTHNQRIAEWVRKLRSGEFRQTTGSLKKEAQMADPDDRPLHCCLGVACEDLPGYSWSRSSNSPSMRLMPGNCSTQWPQSVEDYYQLSVEQLKVIHWYQQEMHEESCVDMLITLNDGARATFDEIALWVEHQLMQRDSVTCELL